MQQRLSEEYENYEPEVSVWPYVLLGFIVPLVPFLSHFLLIENYVPAIEGNAFNVLYMLPIAALYFITAYVVRTSRGSILLLLDGLFYFFITLFYWGIKTKNGDQLSYSLCTLISPAFLAPLSYAFYAKRKRLPLWALSLLLTLLAAALMLSYLILCHSVTERAKLISYLLISLLALVSLLTFFVTRRMESTPAFIMVPLALFAFLTLMTGNGFEKSLISARSFFIYLLIEIISSYAFWFSVSFVVIYQALSHKSSFRNIGIAFEDKDKEYTEEKESTDFYPEGYKPYPNDDKDYRTAYPPQNSRFSNDNKEEAKPESEPEMEERRAPAERDYYDDRPQRRPRPRRRVVEYYDYDDDYDMDYEDRRYRERRERDEYDDRRERSRTRDYYDDRRELPSRDYDDRRHREVRDLDYEDDPRSQYDKWYNLIKGDDRNQMPRRDR